MAPDSNVSTGGGHNIGGNATSGGDWIGRDKVSVYPENLSQDDKLNTIFRYLLGDPLSGIVGQVEQMRRLTDRMEQLEKAMQDAWQREAPKEKEVNDRFSNVHVWLLVLSVVLVPDLILTLFLMIVFFWGR